MKTTKKNQTNTKILYLHMQMTNFTCGTASYLTLTKNRRHDILEHINEEINRMLFIKKVSNALIVTALNFAELAEEDQNLDKLEGLFFLKCPYVPYTLSDKILNLVSKYENLSLDQVLSFKKKYEERIKKYTSYIKVLKKEQFEKQLIFYLKKPLKYSIAALTYQTLNKDKVPHWVVVLSMVYSSNNRTDSNIILSYDPYRNAILYSKKSQFFELIYGIEELETAPQFVVFKKT